MTTSKGDPSALRAMNRRTILNHLRRIGPVSRTKLAELTGLSPASITGVTAELIEDRWLIEQSIGEAGSSGGRRPIFMDINYEAHYAVGLQLNGHRLEGVITDLSLKVLAHLSEDLSEHDPARVTAQIAALCKRLYKRAKVSSDDVIGIGIGLSGVIDAVRGIAVHAPVLAWRHVNIAQLVGEKTGLPVWVDNDVNSFAAAEKLFGHAKHANNFLAVAIGRGLGASIICNGEIHRGRDGGAGEFGHNKIQVGGRRCSCGQQGCLEAYTTEPGLLAQFIERYPKKKGITILELVQLAEGGHKGALETLQTAGALLGLHVSYLVNAFNPELIVFGGEGAELGPSYFEPLRETLRSRAFDGLADELPLIVVPWSDDDFTLWTQGAASLAIQHAFDTSVLEMQRTPQPAF
jgi:predicted NBD/HSP70 family sugar kinase